MANEYGKEWRIKIGNGATPTEVFTAIGGETSLTWSRSSQEIDIGDKDSGVYGGTSYGQQKITFRVAGNLKLPDVGFQAAFDKSKASPPEVNIQVVKGALVKYKGKVAIGNFSAEFPKDGPATYSFDMSNVDAPTVDDMGVAA